MRIAYITADAGNPVNGGKGASVHIQELVRALVGLGHDVEVVCARAGDPATSFADFAPRVFSPEGDLSVSGSDLTVSDAQASKELRRLAIARAVAAKTLARHAAAPFDAVYERYSLWSTAGLEVSRTLRLPFVLEVNAPLRQEQKAYRSLADSAMATRIEREMFAGADAIIAVSEGVAAYVRANGASASRVHVVPNGVDLERFDPSRGRADIAGFAGRPIIGFTGSLKPWHGIDTLLEAYRMLVEEGSDARLLMVGEGPMRAWIEGFAAGTRLAGRINLTGWVDHADVPALLQTMSVAVAPYPALDEFYFSPLKLFEYMAAGRPIVASGIGQIDEVIEDGVTGLLVAPGDVEALASAVRTLLKDHDMADRLGRAGRCAAQNYSWQSNARKVLGLFQDGVCARVRVAAQ